MREKTLFEKGKEISYPQKYRTVAFSTHSKEAHFFIPILPLLRIKLFSRTSVLFRNLNSRQIQISKNAITEHDYIWFYSINNILGIKNLLTSGSCNTIFLYLPCPPDVDVWQPNMFSSSDSFPAAHLSQSGKFLNYTCNKNPEYFCICPEHLIMM